jgi:hypothetical protein
MASERNLTSRDRGSIPDDVNGTCRNPLLNSLLTAIISNDVNRSPFLLQIGYKVLKRI